MKKKISLIAILIICVSLSITANASQSQTDTEVEVYVMTDGNLTAYFNGTSNGGEVNYWIDGIEVITEFQNIYNKIQKVKSDLNNIDAKASAAMAYTMTNSNQINIHNKSIEDLKIKVYMLRDELVAFENHYFAFEEETQKNFSKINETIESIKDDIQDILDELEDIQLTLDAHAQQINANMQAIADNEANLASLSGNLANLGKIVAGATVVVCGLYLFNRKYPFAEIVQNGKEAVKGERQHKIIDYVKRTGNKPKKAKTKGLIYKIKHVRRNPDRSPIKLFFSFLMTMK